MDRTTLLGLNDLLCFINLPYRGQSLDFQKLFSENANLLYRFTKSRLNDEEEIEDVIQETFLAVMESWEKFREDSSPSSWMIGILKNKIIDVYRKKFKDSKVINESDLNLEIFDDAGSWINNQADSRSSIHESYERSVVWESFLECIKALPSQHRILYRLREFEKLDTNSICKKLNISTSNLHVLLHRIRLQLKLCLEKKGITNV